MGRWDEDSEGTVITDCECIRVSTKAILCLIPDPLEEGGFREVWIPQSQIMDDSEVWRVGDRGTLVVTAWFSRKEQLVPDE